MTDEAEAEAKRREAVALEILRGGQRRLEAQHQAADRLRGRLWNVVQIALPLAIAVVTAGLAVMFGAVRSAHPGLGLGAIGVAVMFLAPIIAALQGLAPEEWREPGMAPGQIDFEIYATVPLSDAYRSFATGQQQAYDFNEPKRARIADRLASATLFLVTGIALAMLWVAAAITILAA